MTILSKVIDNLKKAEEASTLKNSSFGFPNDKIQIIDIRFGDNEKGKVGDIIHPDEYIKKITKIYRETWIIPRIKESREMLELHADILEELFKMTSILENSKLDILIKKLKANMIDD